MIRNKIIIWGRDDFNTLGLLRELGSVGLSVIFLIKGDKSYASQSKYCKEYVSYATTEECAEYLLTAFKNESLKPILILSGDKISVYVDDKKELFSRYFIIPGSKKGLLRKYTDKNNMTELASHLGIQCPKSHYIRWDSDISGIDYPCLIKPSHQKKSSYNEFKFRICRTESDLKKTLKYVNHESEFIVQQYINKDYEILIYGARMWDDNTVFAGAFRKERLADSGSGSFGIISGIPSFINTKLISDYLEYIDYHGLFSFEYGVIGNNAFFFEVNLRNDGTSHYFYQAGLNIPLAYVYSCVNKEYNSIITSNISNAVFIDEVFDIENVIKMKISYKQWKKDKDQATIYKYYDVNDMAPWSYVYRRRWIQIIQDLVLNKFRLYIIYILDKIKR